MLLKCLCLLMAIQISTSKEIKSFEITDHDKPRSKPCSNTQLNIEGKINPELAVFRDFPSKPVLVSPDSPCAGMTETCCYPTKEKQILPYAIKEYHEKMQTIFDQKLKTCKIAGRNFERNLYVNFNQSIQLLTREVAKVANQSNITEEVFKDLSDFLYKFIYKQDFCELVEMLKNQIKAIFNKIYESRKVNDTTPDNIRNDYEEYFVTSWYNLTLQNLMEPLNTIRLIGESFDMLKLLITEVRKYRFNAPCRKALFRIKYCSYCVGYKKVTLCDGTCLNAFRGCTANLAELNPIVKQIKSSLKDIGRLAHIELHPMKLLEVYLFDFIKLTKHIQSVDFTESLIERQSDDFKKISQEPPKMHVNHSSVSHNLMSSLQDDLKCFNEVETLLLQLPEAVCDVNPRHLMYIQRDYCWNGTAFGSYQHSIAGHFKVDQLTNPEFKNSSLSDDNPFNSTLNKVDQLMFDINRTLSYYHCLERDDEDCKMEFLLYCNVIKPPAPIDIEYGSGYGNGSGSGSGWMPANPRSDKQTDLEPINRNPLVIVVGNSRRFNDAGNEHSKAIPHINRPTSSSANTLPNTLPPITATSSSSSTTTTITTTSTTTTTRVTTPTLVENPKSSTESRQRTTFTAGLTIILLILVGILL